MEAACSFEGVNHSKQEQRLMLECQGGSQMTSVTGVRRNYPRGKQDAGALLRLLSLYLHFFSHHQAVHSINQGLLSRASSKNVPVRLYCELTCWHILKAVSWKS